MNQINPQSNATSAAVAIGAASVLCRADAVPPHADGHQLVTRRPGQATFSGEALRLRPRAHNPSRPAAKSGNAPGSG